MSNEIEFITPPNTLRAKMGSSFKGFSSDAVAKAEAALADMSGEFEAWLADEVTKLEAADAVVRTAGTEAAVNEKALESLYLRAHDLKGLGTTYGYPLVSRIAGSLCTLIDNAEARARAPRKLLHAHVDAIKASVAAKATSVDHPIGAVLAMELEKKVAAFTG
jgi:hypothetical protein